MATDALLPFSSRLEKLESVPERPAGRVGPIVDILPRRARRPRSALPEVSAPARRPMRRLRADRL